MPKKNPAPSKKPVVITETPLSTVQDIISSIDSQKNKLDIAYEKGLEKINKQFDKLKVKQTKIKTKVATDKQKLQDAKIKLKAKKTATNESRLEKLKEIHTNSVSQLELLKPEYNEVNTQLASIKALHKKHKAQQKVMIKFEKEWEKSLKPKKSTMKKAKKSVDVVNKKSATNKAPSIETKKEILNDDNVVSITG